MVVFWKSVLAVWCTVVYCGELSRGSSSCVRVSSVVCSKLHRNTLKHTSTHCTTRPCNTLLESLLSGLFMCCSVFSCVAVCCRMLQGAAVASRWPFCLRDSEVCCSVWQWVTNTRGLPFCFRVSWVCCSVLQCVSQCRVLQWVTVTTGMPFCFTVSWVCCRVLQWVTITRRVPFFLESLLSVLQSVVVSYSHKNLYCCVCKYVAVCCSV